jgi:hypothetical protein
MPSASVKTPILLLVFNRLDTTMAVLDAIRKVSPARLYVASDGPRQSRAGEDIKVKAVRDYVMSCVTWACDVKTLYRDENLGCRKSVSGAIDWFFEHESEGIILEDDCLPDLSFFAYCDELLERYRDDERIMAISGNNFQQGRERTADSYYFSKHSHCWGWATWQRAWKQYDRDMAGWPKCRDNRELRYLADTGRAFSRYWEGIFDAAAAGKVDSWAYRWTFSCWMQSGLTCLPRVNLVSNIGFGPESTHTGNSDSWLGALPRASLEFPLRHPSHVVRNVDADSWSDRVLFGASTGARLKQKLRNGPGGSILAKAFRFYKGRRRI